MKFKSLLVVAAMVLCTVPVLAQDHGEFGVYGEYMRFAPAGNVNMGGLGARLSLNATKIFKLEAALGYDFQQNFPEKYSNGVSFTTVQSNLRVLNGLFGPAIQTNVGPVRAFFTAKGGFINTSFSNSSPGSGFVSQLQALRTNNVNAVFYPGAGFEAFAGPIGLRFDVGDEIQFVDSGPYNNLRFTFGPMFRF
jgi:hypothetical protein